MPVTLSSYLGTTWTGPAGQQGIQGTSGGGGSTGAQGTSGIQGPAGTTINSASNLQINSLGVGTAPSGTTGDTTISGNASFTGTGSVAISSGTTAQRPAAPANGAIRYNNSTQRFEYNIESFWIQDQDGYTTILGKTRTVFQGTGANQSYVVPAGITRIFVKMWGAGGGAGSYGGWRQGSTGGAGGYSEAIVPVTAGQTLTVIVGVAGRARHGTLAGWPNGGAASTGGGDNQYAGSGGGSSSLIVPTLNSGNACMWAGGGGGGGSLNGWGRNPGGAGGGLIGENGYFSEGSVNTNYTTFATVGKGGTQTAGGAGGVGGNSTGGAGFLGGGGIHQNTNCYGGGGGGGFYGGGSGAYNNGNSMAGGGGGSGFIFSSLIRAQTLTGMREYPPCMNDPDVVEFVNSTTNRIAVGGDEGSNGGNGLVVIYH
jgi:hypothetical protein